jgi:hypothetical protein
MLGVDISTAKVPISIVDMPYGGRELGLMWRQQLQYPKWILMLLENRALYACAGAIRAEGSFEGRSKVDFIRRGRCMQPNGYIISMATWIIQLVWPSGKITMWT